MPGVKLTRYGFKFDVTMADSHPELARGCGVTAYTKDDARHLIQRYILKGQPMPPIRSITEDLDVSTLEENHILPNIGNTVQRGIRFPLISGW